jgi:hypothetical protein
MVEAIFYIGALVSICIGWFAVERENRRLKRELAEAHSLLRASDRLLREEQRRSRS